MPDHSDPNNSQKKSRVLPMPPENFRAPVPPAVNNTCEDHNDNGAPLSAGTTAVPLKSESLAPTPPTPPEGFFEKQPPASGLSADRAKPAFPSAVRLTDPAPPIPLLEKKVAELVALQGEHPGQDLIADVMMTALRMVRDGTTRGELKILAASLRELRYAFNVFRPYQQRRKVTVFGSARTKPGEPEYEQAKLFSEEMVRRNYMIITGAGPGIMEAAQGGAGRENSFGVNIKLPFEQRIRFVAASGGTGNFLVVPVGQENAPLSITK